MSFSEETSFQNDEDTLGKISTQDKEATVVKESHEEKNVLETEIENEKKLGNSNEIENDMTSSVLIKNNLEDSNNLLSNDANPSNLDEHTNLEEDKKEYDEKHNKKNEKNEKTEKNQINEIPVIPKTRLVIKKLVLENFKSYAGKQIIGPFNTSFSSIVGPNGSGKSNVIDSLLFVFGFRASKMRQGKISALIHNSSKFPNLSFCSVEVHFCEIYVDKINKTENNSEINSELNSVDPQIVPGSEIIISRKAFKNNISKYFINSRESSFTEVTTILREKGIDIDHKRFLILQGEVESIAQMKPKALHENDDGLLEYLEDIIGTSKYKDSIEKSIQELDDLNEGLSEKSNRLDIVGKEKKNLQSKRETILDYIRIENKLALKQSEFYQAKRFKYINHVNILSKLNNDLNQELKLELEKFSGNELEIKELKSKYQHTEQELKELSTGISKLTKSLAKYERQEVQIDERKNFLNSKLKKLQKTILSTATAGREAESRAAQNTSDIEEIKEQIEDYESKLETEKSALAVIRDELKDKTASFTADIEVKQKSLEPWKDQVFEKKSQIEVIQSQIDLLIEESTASERELEKAKLKFEEIINAGKEKEAELHNTQSELKHVNEQIELGTQECSRAKDRLDKMREQLAGMRQKTDEASASLSASRSSNAVLDGLSRLRDSGRVSGFHGRLGDLGTINEKYDIAISTACPTLNNIVVDSVETGQQCVEYLRKSNLGRAVFILLDRLASRDMSRINTPENVPRLFDLVKPKDIKFAPAFYNALQDTLVATDLEQANRIAYGKRRWRVVTLQGQLIDKSGTMTGGGAKVNRGGMRSVPINDEISPDLIERMKAEMQGHEKTFFAAQDAYKVMDTTLRDLMKQKPSLEMKISKINMEISSLANQATEFKKQYAEMVKKHKLSLKDEEGNNNKLETLQLNKKSLEEALERINLKAKRIEQEIEGLTERIMETGGIKLRAQQSKVDGILQQIEILNGRVATAETEKRKAEKDIARHLHTVKSTQSDLKESEEALQKIDEELAENRKNLSIVSDQLKEVESLYETTKDNSETLKNQLDEKVNEYNAMRSAEVELKTKIEQNEKVLSDYNARVASCNEKLNSLTLSPYTPYVEEADQEEHENNIKNKMEILENSIKFEDDENEDEDEDEDDDDDEGDIENKKNKKNKVKVEDQSDLEEAEFHDDSDEENIQIRSRRRNFGRKEILINKEIKPNNQMKLEIFSEDALKDLDIDEIKKEISLLEGKLTDAMIDEGVLKEYKKRQEEYSERQSELKTATQLRDESKAMLEDLRKRRLDEFMTGFNAISMKLKEMYQMITMGGNAELELVDSLDPFSEGILFSVMPPKKSWKNISNLSGGEKTLSSLALVFALHHYKPTPLYVMDEIDAALDFRNVSIVANYIKERTKNAQFIVISLRNNMFELAQQLIGIYKVNHMTKSVTIQNLDIVHHHIKA